MRKQPNVTHITTDTTTYNIPNGVCVHNQLIRQNTTWTFHIDVSFHGAASRASVRSNCGRDVSLCARELDLFVVFEFGDLFTEPERTCDFEQKDCDNVDINVNMQTQIKERTSLNKLSMKLITSRDHSWMFCDLIKVGY